MRPGSLLWVSQRPDNVSAAASASSVWIHQGRPRSLVCACAAKDRNAMR